MKSCVPCHFGMNHVLYNKVQINSDFHTKYKEEKISTHDHITSYSNRLSVEELRNDLKGSQIVSSIDSSKFVLKEGFDFYYNQLFEIENYNQPNTDISDDYSKMLVFPFSLSQVVNPEVFKLNEKFQENGTLLLQLKIMISSCYFNPTNNTRILLQDSFHTNPVPYFHQKYFSSMNSFDAHWLEFSYLEKFSKNGNIIFTLFVKKHQGGKLNTFFFYPPHEEIHKKTEKCQDDGVLQSWLMVMSGPHNFGKFYELSCILPCFIDT